MRDVFVERGHTKPQPRISSHAALDEFWKEQRWVGWQEGSRALLELTPQGAGVRVGVGDRGRQGLGVA